MNPWVFSGFLVFLLSRIFILTVFDPYVTDVVIYFEQAKQALSGLKAYTDFSFPYPPFALPLIYLPGLFSLEGFYPYRDAFNKELLILDIALMLMVYRLMKVNFKLQPKQIFNGFLLFSFFGLMQGHLLYDRIDLGVAIINTGLLMLALSPLDWKVGAGLSNIGVLFKFIPFFPASFLYLIKHSTEKRMRLFIKLTLFVIPTLILIYILEHSTHPGIVGYLFEHQERGIQIESLWATPYMLERVWSAASHVGVDTNFGAQHLKDEAISGLVLFLSKSFGFILLAGLGLVILIKRPKVTKELLLLTPTVVLLTFLSTQRVLSPQFFIWLIPFLTMTIVTLRSRALLISSVLLYTLTYIGFDLGYWEFVKFNPFFVHVVATRNLVLLILTCTMMVQWFKRVDSNYKA